MFGVAFLVGLGCGDGGAQRGAPDMAQAFTGQTGTILFVTQVPSVGFATISSTFANHTGDVFSAPRGGDLMIRYPDGTLRNLTREAGLGSAGLQGANAIAVREPAVHWSGNRAVFSMVVGAPAKQYDYATYRWQLYEVSGLAKGEAVAITKVANQPADYNNVAPCYASDDRILFVSDRPRSGEAHLYPQLDEYESTPTTTGIYSLDPVSAELVLLNHTPSGAFSPQVDSFGRVIFTKWDHLQRDQQADADRANPGTYGAFTYSDESTSATKIVSLDGTEVFPEPRSATDPDAEPNTAVHTFNQFFPWQLHQDGTGEETLNHVGRHELSGSYSDPSFLDDSNLSYLTPESSHANRYSVGSDGGMFHLREDPANPGRYYASHVREFGTASAGALLRFEGAPSVNPDALTITAVTHTDSYLQPEDPKDAPNSTGHYRNPLPMSDGTLIASHAPTIGAATNVGTRALPQVNYQFRLRVLEKVGEHWQAGGALTPGLVADVRYFDPDVDVTYQGPLWELDAVEVAPRPRPPTTTEPIEAPEMSIFAETGVNVAELKTWLRQNGLALIISRNVTSRDRADVQQPFNLQVPGGVKTVGAGGTVYDVSHLQLFQADALRAYGDGAGRGRRLLARPVHGDKVTAATGGSAPGSVEIASDGSIAAFVPARRALSWQLTSPTGGAVVRERNWVSFQAGEIRTCPVCHGVNTADQSGAPVATNPPAALRALLNEWLANH